LVLIRFFWGDFGIAFIGGLTLKGNFHASWLE